MSGDQYNKKSRNFYLKVLSVQEEYQRYKTEGVSSRYIYRTRIRHVYFITERTMYKYLTINAKKALKTLDHNQ